MALSSLPAALLAHRPGLEGVTSRCLNAMTFQRPLGILFGENDRKNDHLIGLLGGFNEFTYGKLLGTPGMQKAPGKCLLLVLLS